MTLEVTTKLAGLLQKLAQTATCLETLSEPKKLEQLCEESKDRYKYPTPLEVTKTPCVIGGLTRCPVCASPTLYYDVVAESDVVRISCAKGCVTVLCNFTNVTSYNSKSNKET